MPDFDPTRPFALLRDGGETLLFTNPHGVIAGNDLPAALPMLRRTNGWLAGGLSFESGLQLEPRLAAGGNSGGFHWFGCFGAPRRLSDAGLGQLLAPYRARQAAPGRPEPLIEKADWLRMVHRAQVYIAAGDIYQVNLTFPVRLPVAGHPLALFAHLFDAAASPHGGVVHDGAGRWWLSFSPELFFRLEGGRLLARPMKGTAARAPGLDEDRQAALALAADPKNRAENLMITDLLRNDLGRVAATGSVRTSGLFDIETYPSVHQMTSSIEARLGEGLDAVDVLTALYPCGSITGAPKIRAIEILRELEPFPRGLYCGAMGWLAPGAESAQLNVAIRTIVIEGGRATLGLGAGITSGSDPEAEWAECLLKGRFLRAAAPETLIETMRQEADGRIPRLALHLERLERSAARFAFPFDRPAIERRLAGLSTGRLRRLRLLLGSTGEVVLQLSPLAVPPDAPVEVALVPAPLAADDWRLCHKSGSRAFHDRARRDSGRFECLYERADGWLTEGSFTNLFVPRGDLLLTPPSRLGLLPGVLRAELLQQGRAIEAPLCRADLAGGFLLGNSLRGLFPARLATTSCG